MAPAASAQGAQIAMWIHAGPGPERDAYVASVAAFNQQEQRMFRSTTASLRLMAEADYSKSVEAAAASRTLPCVLEFDGPNVAAYAASGHLQPLDDFEPLMRIRNSTLRSLVRQGTVNGKLYSLGQYDSGLALWGNRKLLDKVGARIPTKAGQGWTLAEFEDVLGRLKRAGVPHPLDMKFNYGIGEWITYGFSPIVQGFGGDLINRKDMSQAHGVLNSAASVEALSTLKGWVTAGYVDTQPADDTAFTSGQSALSWVGHWVYKDYKKALGNDLVLIPLPRFGDKTVVGSGSWNFGIASTCNDKPAAARLVEHLMSRAEVLRVTAINGAVPGTGAAMAFSPLYNEGGELRLYADQLLSGLAVVRPPTPHYPIVSQEFAAAVSRAVKGGDPQKELDEAANQIDKRIRAAKPNAAAGS